MQRAFHCVIPTLVAILEELVANDTEIFLPTYPRCSSFFCRKTKSITRNQETLVMMRPAW